ncbi:uncharacterized protein DNG_05465 [Cephalotrichum gorgonifer]|uniref:Uncharacterized protein n=1 Tax=Cephalotrichum gorgonifer TaxID=2041049 RepID=A0AAE8SVH5_9PEZI|nr:uncharacterized protein DNG_05465 [Cephalotrichum gorgonifer]
MATSNPNAPRSELFQKLKPCCVPISRLVIEPPDGAPAFRKLSDLLDELLAILGSREAVALDGKLADYIFFPLSYIFRSQDKYPPPILERSIRCLTIIIERGWGAGGIAPLVQQLLLLFSFIIGGVPTSPSKQETSEETTLEALKALVTLFKVSASSPEAVSALIAPAAIPHLGHAVTVVLDATIGAASAEIQLEALEVLEHIFKAVNDHEAQASFLPGTVSTLTKLVSTPAKQKTRVLVSAISKLQFILTRVLSDVRVGVIIAKAEKSKEKGPNDKVLTPDWLKATAGQVRIALGTVLKLRDNDAGAVREALEGLCITLLDECNSSLSNCADVLVQTAIVLLSGERRTSIRDTSLEDLARIYPELSGHIKSAAYDWATSLARIMQSTDETAKKRAISRLINALSLISSLDIRSDTLDEHLTASLRDAVSQLITSHQTAPKVQDEVTMDEVVTETSLITRSSQASVYKPILMEHESQRQTREYMLELVQGAGSSAQRSRMAGSLLEYAKQPTGPSHLASYWLSFKLLQSTLTKSDELDQYLEFSSSYSALSPIDDPEELFRDLYSFSVFTLDPNSELTDINWRFEAVALEVIGFAAARAGVAFRPELIDVLFPICTLLGADHPQLRHHAMVTLNNLAMHCGYGTVSELIIGNADYMVNSVSLLLNSLSISPAATKVLRMMIRLSGPRIVPYLDDVVASVFAALDSYHGYPVFVDALFSALKEVVEQGVKSSNLLLKGDESSVDHRKRPAPKVTIGDVIKEIKERENRKRKRDEEDRRLDEEVASGHPRAPWKAPRKDQPSRITELDDEDEAQDEGMADAPEAPEAPEDEPPQEDDDEMKPKKTPTYTLLNKIANLTQHYLTSPTPTLRKKLLDLLSTVSPALATDPDSFLPLVNDVWPVVVTRLYDAEPFVSIAACETLAALCSCAGDFLGTRFKTEWWDRMGRWCRNVKREAEKVKGRRDVVPALGSAGIVIPIRGRENPAPPRSEVVVAATSSGGLGKFAQAAKVWEAVVDLLVAVVSHVRVEDEMFDEILGILGDLITVRRDVREALEVVNADAVWLELYERGEVEWTPAPVMGRVWSLSSWRREEGQLQG